MKGILTAHWVHTVQLQGRYWEIWFQLYTTIGPWQTHSHSQQINKLLEVNELSSTRRLLCFVKACVCWPREHPSVHNCTALFSRVLLYPMRIALPRKRDTKRSKYKGDTVSLLDQAGRQVGRILHLGRSKPRSPFFSYATEGLLTSQPKAKKTQAH